MRRTQVYMDSYNHPCSLYKSHKLFQSVDLELYIHMYAVPSEVIRSNINTYGRNCLEDNPSYLSNIHHACIKLGKLTSHIIYYSCSIM